jgi:hypothetical protein
VDGVAKIGSRALRSISRRDRESAAAGLLPHLFDLRVATNGPAAPIVMHVLYAPLAKRSTRLNLTWVWIKAE